MEPAEKVDAVSCIRAMTFSKSRRTTGEDKVASLDLIAYGKECRRECLVAGFAVCEGTEPSAACRGVIPDHELNACGGAGDQRLRPAKDFAVFLGHCKAAMLAPSGNESLLAVGFDREIVI